jgi:hypothetical protein
LAQAEQDLSANRGIQDMFGLLFFSCGLVFFFFRRHLYSTLCVKKDKDTGLGTKRRTRGPLRLAAVVPVDCLEARWRL